MRLYIDPGTGSMLFAILIGAIGVARFVLKGIFVKLKFLFTGGRQTMTPRCKALILICMRSLSGRETRLLPDSIL